jgi:hypothetical protein
MIKITKKSHSSDKSNESITIRLDRSILRTLKVEASQKQITPNTLITQVLKQHINWHSHASEAGFIAARRNLILKLLEKVSEEDLMIISEHIAKTETKDFVRMLRNEYSITSALNALETWMTICGYPYRHEINNDSKHSYIIHHDMGKKWSLYLAELYRFLFKEFGVNQADFDISDSALSFDVQC